MNLAMPTSSTALPIAVMVSGRGSNLETIIQQAKSGQCAVDVRLVISDKANAPALALAKKYGVPIVQHMDPKAFSNREAFDMACAALIQEHGCQWIVLAGYMRILSSSFVQSFIGRIINIHPSLLPAFVGGTAVKDALDYGVKVTGCSVHLVDDVLDGGPILAQRVVHVDDHDTQQSLHARIQEQEHILYPEVLHRIASQGFALHGRTAIWNQPSLA